jgi:hypothetical protein
MDRAAADLHVAELGKRLGMPGLALGEDGMCILSIDNGVLLPTIGYNQRTGTLDVMICMDEAVPSGRQLYRLLAANFAWTRSEGATFAVEPGSGALVVQRRCGPDDLAHGLMPVLEGLTALATYWTKHLTEAEPKEHKHLIGLRGSCPAFPSSPWQP